MDEPVDEPLAEPARLTDEQVGRALGEIFEDVAATQQRVHAGGLFEPVQPRSSLAADDDVAFPYQLSHGVTAAVGIAVEHLDALRALIVDAKVLHPHAPFTITRTALEAGSSAVWLLGPKARSERVLRRCRQMRKDAADGDTAARGFGLPPPSDPQSRIAKLTEIARKAAKNPSLKLGSTTTTAIVEYADDYLGRSWPLRAWRVCAGISHARMWSTLSMLDREDHDSPDPRVVNAKVTSSLERVLWAVTAAHEVVIAATELYEQRRVRHY